MTTQVQLQERIVEPVAVTTPAYEAVASALADGGVDTIFCVLGDANLELMAFAAASRGIRLVHARHEQGAVAMADGYARATGGIGVCSVTCGPGLTNAATSLATAAKHGSRVLLIAGDVALGDRRNVQRLDQLRFVDTLGARCLIPTSAPAVLTDLAAALRHVNSGAGPAVFDLPIDVQHAPIDSLARCPGWRSPLRMHVEPDPIVINEAAEVLASAERPALLVGRGANAASDGILELAERLNAPVVTTLRAKGLAHGHRLDAGVSGALGDPEAAEVLLAADVICVLGARLDTWTTSGGKLLASAANVVQVDIDAAVLSDVDHVTIPVLGDAGTAARRLNTVLSQMLVDPPAWWTRPLPEVATRCACTGLVHPAHAVRALDAALDEDRIVVLDGGHFAIFTAQGLTAFDPARFIFTSDFGAIGQGLGVAIGAASGGTGSRVTAVVGDGCLMMAMAELDTVAQLDLPLTIFVMNDQGYGQERHSLEAKGFSPREAAHRTPDLVSVARAAGLEAERIATCSELRGLPHLLSHARGPLLIDVAIDGSVLNPAARAIFQRARAAKGA